MGSEKNARGVKAITSWLVITAAAMLIGALALTIVGSSANLDGLLSAGIACWFAGIALLFLSLVAWMWARTSRYGNGGRS